MNRRRVSLLVALLGMALAIGAPVLALASTGASHASVELRDAAGSVVGWADLTEDATGRLHVNVHVKGVSAGLHGIHIHAVGSCSPDFGAAGGHHNPLGVAHGLDSASGGHAGDLPNLEVNAAGVGHLDGTSDRASLSNGPTTVFDGDGSALVIHAGPDDQVTNPTGNSGGRIACGVIVAG
ncbi:MAG TPA: superoxide dismutase family protein [Candidatus Limnocylindrales bacterium]|nr:superoxide dismutase family protein [Candidatus Limnocylindrales bacterium]